MSAFLVEKLPAAPRAADRDIDSSSPQLEVCEAHVARPCSWRTRRSRPRTSARRRAEDVRAGRSWRIPTANIGAVVEIAFFRAPVHGVPDGASSFLIRADVLSTGARFDSRHLEPAIILHAAPMLAIGIVGNQQGPGRRHIASAEPVHARPARIKRRALPTSRREPHFVAPNASRLSAASRCEQIECP